MKIKMFQVDAFSDKLFCGNPAAVCILKKNLDEKLMQKIALENNLSETAYVLKKNNEYEIRWFTPKKEVDLCGHATLASAHVLYEYFIQKLKQSGITVETGEFQTMMDISLVNSGPVTIMLESNQ